MKYTENITGIKINVQAVDISIGDDIMDTLVYNTTYFSSNHACSSLRWYGKSFN